MNALTADITTTVTVTLTDAEVEAVCRIVADRQAANKGRQHIAAYRAGAAVGAIDTSEEGATLHERQSAAVELAVAKWLGRVKPSGHNLFHAASVTYDQRTHRRLSKTPWSSDVWVYGDDQRAGEHVPAEWEAPWHDRPVVAKVEVKKVNKTAGDLIAGEWLKRGGSIRRKDIHPDAPLVEVIGQASEDLRTVVLAGWLIVDEQAWDEAKKASYSPDDSTRVVHVNSLRPMWSLPLEVYIGPDLIPASVRASVREVVVGCFLGQENWPKNIPV